MIIKNEDIYSATEVRQNFADIIDKTKTTKRPVLVTQNGKGSVVVVDVDEYERMEVLAGIAVGEKDMLEGRVISHEQLKKDLKKRK